MTAPAKPAKPKAPPKPATGAAYSQGSYDGWAQDRRGRRQAVEQRGTPQSAKQPKRCAECGSKTALVTSVSLFGARTLCRPGKGCQAKAATRLPGKQSRAKLAFAWGSTSRPRQRSSLTLFPKVTTKARKKTVWTW